jgi:hypothetical protein
VDSLQDHGDSVSTCYEGDDSGVLAMLEACADNSDGSITLEASASDGSPEYSTAQESLPFSGSPAIP